MIGSAGSCALQKTLKKERNKNTLVILHSRPSNTYVIKLFVICKTANRRTKQRIECDLLRQIRGQVLDKKARNEFGDRNTVVSRRIVPGGGVVWMYWT